MRTTIRTSFVRAGAFALLGLALAAAACSDDETPAKAPDAAKPADLLEAGATVVAVGTESFRDPAAGTRIQHELHDLFAKSGNIAETASDV